MNPIQALFIVALIVMIGVAATISGLVAYAIGYQGLFGEQSGDHSDEITYDENSGSWRFTDISDRGFDCKTIMWDSSMMTCVDWDGVRT